MEKTGFTLLEILVVLVIIGIILSFATLSIHQSGTTTVLEHETQRLVSLLTLASQEAVLQNTDLGLSFTKQGYQFYTLKDQHWQQLQRDDLLRPRTFPENLQVTLEIEGEPMTLDNLNQENPQLLVLSSGELTPFILILTADKSTSYRVVADMIGTFNVYRDDRL